MSEIQNAKIFELLEFCFYGHLDQVKELLATGVEVNSIGHNGMSPIGAARDGGNQDIVDFLLSHGATDRSRNEKDENEHTQISHQ